MARTTKLALYYQTVNMAEDYLTQGYSSKRTKAVKVVLKKLAPATTLVGAKGVALKEALPTYSNRAIELASSSDELVNLIANCQQCQLSKTRKNSVAGDGTIPAELLIIGDALSADDELMGRPFQGVTGQFLDKWLSSIGLNRFEHCYITTIVKCRPPQAREPSREEVESCLPYLKKLVSLVKPKAILCCGRSSSQHVTGCYLSLEEIRDRTHRYEGVEVITTYHPRHVLKNDSLKRPVWEDLKRLKIALSQ